MFWMQVDGGNAHPARHGGHVLQPETGAMLFAMKRTSALTWERCDYVA